MKNHNGSKSVTGIKEFFQSALAVQTRNSNSILYSSGIYLATFLGLLAATLVLNNNVQATTKNMLFISQQPLFLPLLISVSFLALLLAVMASINVSRERDRGTLEVLVYGPVNEATFLFGVFIGYLKIYLEMLLIILVWANLATWMLHLAFSLKILLMLVSSVLMAAALIAFGILTAVLGGKARTALVFFFIIVLVLGGIQIADQIVTILLQASDSASNSMIFLRNVLMMLSSGVQWISPYSQFTLMMDGIADSIWRTYFAHLAILLVQTLVLIIGGIKIFERKGVRG